MQLLYLSALAVPQASEGSLWQRVLQTLPTDPASTFVLFLIVAGVGAIVWFGREQNQ